MKTINLLEILDKRFFAIAFIEGNGCTSTILTLEEILMKDNNAEMYYAMQERIDEIVTLKVGERIKMWFNRDNSQDSDGYIKRIEPNN